jgi:LPXTG-motif cell wall-anchored protein
LEPTGKSAFMFWETPAGQPRALRAWFYPGDNFGQEFVYPRSMYLQLAANRRTQTQSQTAMVSEADRSVETAPQPEPAPTTAASAEPVAQPQPVETPAPAPEPATQAEAAPAPAPTPTELPHTASNYPLIALAGLASLGIFIVMSVRTRRA